MKNYITLIFIVFFTSCKKNDIVKGDGEIADPNRLEAALIAEKKFLSAYGKEIHKQKPFVVEKKNDSIYIVEGTFPKPQPGGVAYAEVNIKSKKVVYLTHRE